MGRARQALVAGILRNAYGALTMTTFGGWWVLEMKKGGLEPPFFRV
jgi:hypothetical protein